MPLTIESFRDGHLDAAGDLLAARHRADRQRQSELPARFEEPEHTRKAVEGALRGRGSQGVVALRDGRVVGYLLGSQALPPPTSVFALFMRPRSIRIGYPGHAVDPDGGIEIYRAMYAALATRWTAAGWFSHYVDLAPGDPIANEAWCSLGFGRDIVAAVRDTGPVEGRSVAAGIEFRQAGTEDIEEVLRLTTALLRYHAGPPIFFPYLPETESEGRGMQHGMLSNPACATWLAYRDGRALAVQTFEPPQDMINEMQQPDLPSIYLFQGYTETDDRGGGVGTALLSHTMAWARDAGYERCALHFMSANLAGARFWQGHGFRPIEYRMHRHVDERIAWGTTPS
jgi:GNAT superfamily N-acetyltransferase